MSRWSDDTTSSTADPSARRGEWTRASARPNSSGAINVSAAWQDEDYRAETLFNRNHRELLQRVRGYRSDIEVAFLHQNGQKLRGRVGEFDTDEIGGRIRHEVVIDPDSWLTFGGKFKSRNLDFGTGFVPGASGADDDERLYETAGLIGFGTFIEDNLYIEGEFELGLYSDFQGTLNSQDWQFFGQVQGTYEVTESFAWRAGLRTDQRFEDVDVYAQLGFAWSISEDWRLDLLLPQIIEVTWNPAPEWLFNLGISYEGQEYAVRSPSAFGGELNTWEAREIRLYTGARLRFNDQLSTFGRIGGTIGGDYEFNGVGATQTSGTPESALFFEVGFGVNL